MGERRLQIESARFPKPLNLRQRGRFGTARATKRHPNANKCDRISLENKVAVINVTPFARDSTPAAAPQFNTLLTYCYHVNFSIVIALVSLTMRRVPPLDIESLSNVGSKEMTEEIPKQYRGFASLPTEQRKLVGSLGGRSVKAENRSFSRDKDLARRAGEVGGRSVPAEKRAFSIDRQLASTAGKCSKISPPKA